MRLKKQHLFVILAACVFICGLAAYGVFAQGTANINALTFASTEGNYVFFDHSSAKIYTYNSRNGELLSVWQLPRLGNNLLKLQ